MDPPFFACCIAVLADWPSSSFDTQTSYFSTSETNRTCALQWADIVRPGTLRPWTSSNLTFWFSSSSERAHVKGR